MARTLVVSLTRQSLSGFFARDLQELVGFRAALFSAGFVAAGAVAYVMIGDRPEQLLIPLAAQVHQHVVAKRIDRLQRSFEADFVWVAMMSFCGAGDHGANEIVG